MSLRIAIEGCGHGTLNAIYQSIERQCEERGWDGVDLLIIGGDFQSVRNAYDLNAMSVPIKYREIGDFHEYYSGVRKAPYLTIFVGGNHEASNYLFELYYGGWVAPNIYYMGAANVVRCGPLRIAGLSGIWKGYNYNKTHHERIPYNQDDVKSIYHVREIDVRKLTQIRTQVDIGISHDWPRGVVWSGNWKALFSFKSHFEEDARNGTLGSVAARYVLDRLRPYYWFSAHLHCKFTATVVHESTGATNAVETDQASQHQIAVQTAVNNADEIDIAMEDDTGPHLTVEAPNSGLNGDEINLEDDTVNEVPAQNDQRLVATTSNGSRSGISEEVLAQLPDSFKQGKRKRSPTPEPFPTGITNKSTEFLALDKCLPKRKFLELREINIHDGLETSQRPYQLAYDDEWLAITRVFASTQKFGDNSAKPAANEGEAFYRPLVEAELQWVRQNLGNQEALTIPENFAQTAPIFDSQISITGTEQPKEYTNNQTTAFCQMLSIPNPFDITEAERQERMDKGPAPSSHGNGSDKNGRGGGRGRGNSGGRGRGRGRSRDRGPGRYR